MASPQQQTTTLQQTIKSGLNGKINGKNWKVSYDDVAAIVDKALVEGSVTLNLDEFSPTNFLSREFDNGPLENDEIRIVHGAVVRLPFLPNTKGWKHNGKSGGQKGPSSDRIEYYSAATKDNLHLRTYANRERTYALAIVYYVCKKVKDIIEEPMEKRRKIDSIFGDFNEKFLENRDSVGDIVDGIIERATYNNFIEEDQGSINSARYISDDFQTQCAVMTKCVIKSPFLDKALGWNLFKTEEKSDIYHSIKARDVWLHTYRHSQEPYKGYVLAVIYRDKEAADSVAKLSISRNKKHPNLPADAQKIKGTLFSKYNFIHRFDESEGDGKKILSVVYIKTFHAAGATAAAATDAVVSKAIKEFGPCKKTELRKDDLGNMLEKDFGQTDFPILSIARISDTLVKVRLSSLSKMEFKEDDWDKVYKTLEKKFKTICSKVDEAATM